MDEMEKPSDAKRTTVRPPSVLAYLDPNYWNERFTSEDHYKWLKDYAHFRHLIHQHIKPDSSVLELGCGNSQLSDELYNEGITNITCIDLSSIM
ncbi:putative endothelin-converting enzyme 1 [Helianthus annuus]|uniref:Endothelin-converting enzyme 1 n=1 Tax=Helianthus annuus TaxID=4232 RepID=A0A251V0X0_HELAN|nr:putative endothelin-converting enzyme 1 [Helianthus annuus]KAJ0932028.1 putative endothelin-converting enzyme 1 [Helianthus annuus]